MKITVFQIQPIERLRSQLIIKLVLLALITTMIIITVPSVLGMATMPGKHTSSGVANMTFVGNMTGGRSMMMPGGNMTFGASLQNAKIPRSCFKQYIT